MVRRDGCRRAGPVMAVLAEGTTFAAYEVRRLLAVGGMGEVYLCHHRLLNRLDAVKVLRPHLSDADFRRRFLREAMLVARVLHPNVVGVYTADEADGLLYLAMEYVAGEDLANLLRREKRLTPARTVALLGPVADALDAAHRAYLVHRDVKPSNLLVAGAESTIEGVRLVDFGISRLVDQDSEITRTGEIVGTMAYCSPEQLSRDQVGAQCDQYSLACVGYECLTGEVPFPREGQLAIMAAHLTAPPPRPSMLRPELPAAVDGVIARGLAKDPAARYPTCGDFVAALGRAIAGEASRRHPVYADPPGLARAVRAGAFATRPSGHPDQLALRVGWRDAPTPAPMVARLTAGPLLVRGEATAVAGCVRWLLAQTVAYHALRDVCLACAVAPEPAENWLWLNWLPHARPTAPPLAGPHVATTAQSAADLVARLHALVAIRGDDPHPRVLAILDQRLGAPAADFAMAGRAGVHVLALAPPEQPAPYGMSTLDISPDGLRCRLSVAGEPTLDGDLEAVDTGYVRQLADHLSDG